MPEPAEKQRTNTAGCKTTMPIISGTISLGHCFSCSDTHQRGWSRRAHRLPWYLAGAAKSGLFRGLAPRSKYTWTAWDHGLSPVARRLPRDVRQLHESAR